MIYTDMTRKAMRIAYEAHHGQTDLAGVPYIYHPAHLAEAFSDEITVCAALLHDVVEDTDWTFEDLRREGFSEKVIEAVQLLYHEKGTDYQPYIKNICQARNMPAMLVKLSDMIHNSDLTRMASPHEEDFDRKVKYSHAEALLLGQIADCVNEEKTAVKDIPLIDRSDFSPSFTKTAENEVIDVGYAEGKLSNGCPYRLECWAQNQITSITVFVSVAGIEEKEPAAILDRLKREGLFKRLGKRQSGYVQLIEDPKGRPFYSVNLVIGIEDELENDSKIPLKSYKRA
jgi:hypothetical protein